LNFTMHISTSALTILALSFATSADAASLKSGAGTGHKDKEELIPLQTAGRKLIQASASAISAFQKSSTIPEPRLLQYYEDPKIQCLYDSENGAMKGNKLLWGLDKNDFTNDNCDGDPWHTCDLSNIKDEAKFVCDTFGGKIVSNTTMVACLEEQDAQDGIVASDFTTLNVPVCFAQTCDDDADLAEIYATAIDAGAIKNAERIEGVGKHFRGEKCDSGYSSGAGIAKTFGSFMLASLAGAAALFTL